MIYFKFNINNPWRRDGEDKIVNYVCKDWNLTKNKSLELQISRWGTADTLLELVLDMRWKGQSHAGPSINVEIGRYFFCIKLYDHRHWDYKRNDWTDHDEREDSEYGVTR